GSARSRVRTTGGAFRIHDRTSGRFDRAGQRRDRARAAHAHPCPTIIRWTTGAIAAGEVSNDMADGNIGETHMLKDRYLSLLAHYAIDAPAPGDTAAHEVARRIADSVGVMAAALDDDAPTAARAM